MRSAEQYHPIEAKGTIYTALTKGKGCPAHYKQEALPVLVPSEP